MEGTDRSKEEKIEVKNEARQRGKKRKEINFHGGKDERVIIVHRGERVEGVGGIKITDRSKFAFYHSPRIGGMRNTDSVGDKSKKDES